MKWTADEIILCGKMGYRKAYKCDEKIWARTTTKEVLGDKIENLEYSQTKGIYTVKATYYYYTEKYDENGTLISRTKNPNHYRIDTNPYFTFIYDYDNRTEFKYFPSKCTNLNKFATRFKTTLDSLPILPTEIPLNLDLFELNRYEIGCSFIIGYRYKPYIPSRMEKSYTSGKTVYYYYPATREAKSFGYNFFSWEAMYPNKSTAICGTSGGMSGEVGNWSQSFDGSFYMTHTPNTSYFNDIYYNGSPLTNQSSPCYVSFCDLHLGLAGTVYSTFINDLIFIPQRNNQLYMSKIEDLKHTGGDPIYGCENSVEYNL